MKRSRKMIVSAAAVFALTLNAAAFAEVNYDEDRNAVSPAEDAVGYSCVLITKAGGGSETAAPAEKLPRYEYADGDFAEIDTKDVVYVDQSSGVFDAAVKFMLREPAEAGEYSVRMGGSGDVKTVGFTISENAAQGEKPMAPVDAEEMPDGSSRVGFAIEDVYLPAYKSILVTYSDGSGQTVTLGYPLSELIDAVVDADTDFGLQINDVPGEYTDSLSVSLSKQEVPQI